MQFTHFISRVSGGSRRLSFFIIWELAGLADRFHFGQCNDESDSVTTANANVGKFCLVQIVYQTPGAWLTYRYILRPTTIYIKLTVTLSMVNNFFLLLFFFLFSSPLPRAFVSRLSANNKFTTRLAKSRMTIFVSDLRHLSRIKVEWITLIFVKCVLMILSRNNYLETLLTRETTEIQIITKL